MAPLGLTDAQRFDERLGRPNLTLDGSVEVFRVPVEPLDVHDQVLGLTR